MCIVFTSEEVRLLSVAGTKIFVAALADGRQLTVYENAVRQDGVADGSAMVLPVPAGAVTFLDLSNAALFYELRQLSDHDGNYGARGGGGGGHALRNV